MAHRDELDALGLADEPDHQPTDADEYRQPSDRELLAIQHRRTLPDIPGISYRCPPVVDDVPTA